jgi:PadR family transcriptional regulator, regulatory protein PadR
MVQDETQETTQDKIVLELRRGILLLAVLSQLHTEQYGYSLKQLLNEKGLAINEGTLYPLLRRLEEQKLLVSDWKVVDDVRPRRYYQMSDEGKRILANLTEEWHALAGVLNKLLG